MYTIFMYCPACLEKMNEQVVDGQQILHCSTCGSTFFEENGINRITQTTARQLAEDKKGMINHDTQKLCPKDNLTIMTKIMDDEAIPKYITLLKCATCRGIFVAPNDLLLFKKAQDVKLDYYKTWDTPLPSVRSVMVVSFLAVVGISILAASISSPQLNTTSTQAEDIVTNINASQSGRYIFISFKTQSPMKSKITLFDKTSNQTIVKTVTETPTTIHTITITDLPVSDNISYQITLTDSNGKEIKTSEKTLEVK